MKQVQRRFWRAASSAAGSLCAALGERAAGAAGAVWAVLIAATMGLAACSSTDKPKPSPLDGVSSQLLVSTHWQLALGAVDFPMQAVFQFGKVALASGDGAVLVIESASGRELWRGAAGQKLSAGVGFDGQRVAVVTQQNELLLFEEGKVLWRKRMGSRVSTPPLVAGERVFVLGVDRAVDAFDVLDGRYLWRLQRPGDPLTLSQPGLLSARGNLLLVGQGSRLAAVDPDRGQVRWELPLATPRGTNEVERLADLLGPPLKLGDSLCARAFQSSVACADVNRATVRWSRNAGGTKPVAGDESLVLGADASDRISAWNTTTGELAWSHERLLYRELSSPLVQPGFVVFGDGQGLLHFMSREAGATLQRAATDGSAIVQLMPAAPAEIWALTRKGSVIALKVEEVRRAP